MWGRETSCAIVSDGTAPYLPNGTAPYLPNGSDLGTVVPLAADKPHSRSHRHHAPSAPSVPDCCPATPHAHQPQVPHCAVVLVCCRARDPVPGCGDPHLGCGATKNFAGVATANQARLGKAPKPGGSRLPRTPRLLHGLSNSAARVTLTVYGALCKRGGRTRGVRAKLA